MLYFLGKWCRVVAHDRRGHARSSQVSEGHDMDHDSSGELMPRVRPAAVTAFLHERLSW
jgi:pimeloyl-ACP methyl ester carboxylesterase